MLKIRNCEQNQRFFTLLKAMVWKSTQGSSMVMARSATKSRTNTQPVADIDLVRSYLRDIGRVPLLTHEQEITFGRQVQGLVELEQIESDLKTRTGAAPTHEAWAAEAGLTPFQLKRRLKNGRRAKDRMVSANLRLVVSIAKKYTKRNMELLDLIQEGTIGLVRGVEKFDPSRGYKFSTYAYWWIRQGITRAIAEKSRAIRLPIHITEALNKLKRGQRELSQRLGRTPTVSELSGVVEIPEDEVKDLLCRVRQPISIDLGVGDGEDTALQDLLRHDGPAPSDMLDRHFLRSDVEALMEELPHLQCEVLKMRYGFGVEEPMSLTGIGRVLGISRDRVRNLERDCMANLRRLQQKVEDYVVG